MLEEETIDYFRYEGARILLAPFQVRIPTSREARNRELEPVIRSLWLSGERGGRTLYEVAAQVRRIADAFDPGMPTDIALPEDVSVMASKLAEGDPSTELRAIAVHVESWKSGFVKKLAAATPTRRELASRFPLLCYFLADYYGQDGAATEDGLTEADGLSSFIEECHQEHICLWTLPPLIAECSEAQAIFQDEASLHRFFEEDNGLGSGNLNWSEWLPMIVDAFRAHMKAEHPPSWTRD